MVKVTPLITGFVIGVWIAIGRAVFSIIPPEVFTVCMISHPNDLFGWVVNHAFGTNLAIHPISRVFPLLTALGVVIGGSIAAARHKELKFKMPAKDPIGAFILGFLVVTSGMILGACPIRTTGLVAYGSMELLVAFLSLVVGVILACEYIKWTVRR